MNTTRLMCWCLTSVVPFCHLQAITFFRTCKNLKNHEWGKYWYILCRKIKQRSLVNHRPYFRHLIKNPLTKPTDIMTREPKAPTHFQASTHYHSTLLHAVKHIQLDQEISDMKETQTWTDTNSNSSNLQYMLMMCTVLYWFGSIFLTFHFTLLKLL